MAVSGGGLCTGRCYCGRVRFAVDLDLIAACKTEVVNAFCHCFDCRRAHAAPLYEVSYVPAACFTITDGAELVNRNMGVRAFCANCGSRIMNDMSARKEVPARLRNKIGFFPNLLDEEWQRELILKAGLASPLCPANNAHVGELAAQGALPQSATSADALHTHTGDVVRPELLSACGKMLARSSQ